MDKHNNPSNNINNSNDNPWEHQANEVENTQEIPVVNDESPKGNGDNNTHSAPEYTPSTYAPETKRESHLGRNLFIGAVAVAAVAGSIALFNGNNQSTKAIDTTGTTQAEQLADTENSDTQFSPDSFGDQPDNNKIQAYKDSAAYSDGLSIQEFANSCGFDDLTEAYRYYGEDISNRLQSEMSAMGYHINGYEVVVSQQGELFSSISSSFTPSNGVANLVGVGVEAYVERNIYHIRIHSVPSNGAHLEYDTDTIPTPDEAAQLLADNQ